MKKTILILFLVFSLGVCAQEPTEEVNPLELTKLESAELRLQIKDVQLNQLQIQIALRAHNTAVRQRDAQQARLNAMLEELRELHKAPADKFTFDAVKMAFVPIPEKPAAAKE